MNDQLHPPAQGVNVLVIGYGNPGRQDDGLGPALVEEVSRQTFQDVTFDTRFLLTVDDAARLREHDVVIFVDASINGAEPFFFQAVQSQSAKTFLSHGADPQVVLGLAQDLFGAKTKGFTLGVRGYAFDDYGDDLSRGAKDNLAAAARFLTNVLKRKDFDSAARGALT